MQQTWLLLCVMSMCISEKWLMTICFASVIVTDPIKCI